MFLGDRRPCNYVNKATQNVRKYKLLRKIYLKRSSFRFLIWAFSFMLVKSKITKKNEFQGNIKTESPLLKAKSKVQTHQTINKTAVIYLTLVQLFFYVQHSGLNPKCLSGMYMIITKYIARVCTIVKQSSKISGLFKSIFTVQGFICYEVYLRNNLLMSCPMVILVGLALYLSIFYTERGQILCLPMLKWAQNMTRRNDSIVIGQLRCLGVPV